MVKDGHGKEVPPEYRSRAVEGCAQCGVSLKRGAHWDTGISTTLTTADRTELRRFCSVECRDKYIEAANG